MGFLIFLLKFLTNGQYLLDLVFASLMSVQFKTSWICAPTLWILLIKLFQLFSKVLKV